MRFFSSLRRSAGGFLFAVFLTGCAPRPSAPPSFPATSETLAPGVLHRAFPGVEIIDVDLSKSSARFAVVSDGVTHAGGPIVGRALTPEQWRERRDALACVNGGYFGREIGEENKEIVGLLVQNGRVRHAAPPMRGRGGHGLEPGEFVRSAFGLTASGMPEIASVSTAPGDAQIMRTHDGPMGNAGNRWRVENAVGCGPTLIRNGKISVTDRRERLASEGELPRTFLAYDGPPGKPTHCVMGIASAMTYDELAAWLAAYFPKSDGTAAQAAMCLDGGASTQLSYVKDGKVQSPRQTEVTVPTGVCVLPR